MTPRPRRRTPSCRTQARNFYDRVVEVCLLVSDASLDGKYFYILAFPSKILEFLLEIRIKVFFCKVRF